LGTENEVSITGELRDGMNPDSGVAFEPTNPTWTISVPKLLSMS
jgi:hypothetical protein